MRAEDELEEGSRRGVILIHQGVDDSFALLDGRAYGTGALLLFNGV